MINYGPAEFSFAPREKVHPGFFSHYKKFWRGAKWQLFLLPSPTLEQSLEQAKRHRVNEGIFPVPAVYEFAISKTRTGDRYKTYVGTTKNATNRHGSYLNDGDHIARFLETAVRNGFFVHRRIRYIIPKPELTPAQIERAAVVAEQTETRFLGKFNYAFNARQNGNEAMTRIPVKKSFLCMFSRVKWLKNPDARKFDM